MNKKAKQEWENIYNLFYYNRIKAYLVATGTSIKYKEIKDKNLSNDVKKVIDQYSLENIFMGQGINMLVSSMETFLKDLFIFLASNNSSIEKAIRKATKNNTKIQLESLIKKRRHKFNFQNLDILSENFKKYLKIDIEKIFNETGARFKHTDKKEQDRIDKIGFFKYFRDDIWPLRHKITHESKVPQYGKDIWGLCFNSLRIIAERIKEEIEDKMLPFL